MSQRSRQARAQGNNRRVQHQQRVSGRGALRSAPGQQPRGNATRVSHTHTRAVPLRGVGRRRASSMRSHSAARVAGDHDTPRTQTVSRPTLTARGEREGRLRYDTNTASAHSEPASQRPAARPQSGARREDATRITPNRKRPRDFLTTPPKANDLAGTIEKVRITRSGRIVRKNMAPDFAEA